MPFSSTTLNRCTNASAALNCSPRKYGPRSVLRGVLGGLIHLNTWNSVQTFITAPGYRPSRMALPPSCAFSSRNAYHWCTNLFENVSMTKMGPLNWITYVQVGGWEGSEMNSRMIKDSAILKDSGEGLVGSDHRPSSVPGHVVCVQSWVEGFKEHKPSR